MLRCRSTRAHRQRNSLSPASGPSGHARKFTRAPKKGMKPRVSVSMLCKEITQNSTTVRIEVQDTGIGIKVEEISLLFLPYRQIRSGFTQNAAACVCVRTCVRACVCACVRACVRACYANECACVDGACA